MVIDIIAIQISTVTSKSTFGDRSWIIDDLSLN